MAGFFMGIGILIMLGAGGCSLFVLGSYGSNDAGIVFLFGGIPFLIGGLIFLLAKWASVATSQAASLASPKKPPVNSFGIPPKPPKED